MDRRLRAVLHPVRRGLLANRQAPCSSGDPTGDVADAVQTRPAIDEPAPSWPRRLLWLALPAFASILLLATTNHICLDVPSVPFLWIVPLSLYLLSFIIAFDHERWYRRLPYGLAALVAIYLAAGIYNSRPCGEHGWLGDAHRLDLGHAAETPWATHDQL